jgi:hypothetical protein
METLYRLDSKRFELPKVKNDKNAPLCDWCKKKEAEFECERCESETGEQPYRFFCGRHIQKIKNHEVIDRSLYIHDTLKYLSCSRNLSNC